MITTKEMLEVMQSGATFSMTVCSYDRKRKKGGEWKTYPEAQLVKTSDVVIQNKRPRTTIEKMQQELQNPIKRNPNHRKHYTRNIRILQNGHPTGMIITIHPPLVDEFNDKTVLV